MDMLFGLPAHPLLVHVTVVAIPVAAVLAALLAVFPRLPQLVKVTALVLGLAGVVLAPLMESSGEALEKRVVRTAAVERHADLGESLLPWVIGLLAVIVLVLVADRWLSRAGSAAVGSSRRVAPSPAVARTVRVAVAIVAIVVAAGTLVQTVRIGHSGAQATWSTPGSTGPTVVQGGR
ncbi:DUF2231 domain-containing protein [Nocardia blacklockiae]|uniref:DUF2231 domain-containing protein n=1 Tax=Nocardia blacklockiae TaxID=480036 RepID=UPI0018961F68|nr:DUF2231 domain-containing protein [Nocardia blacklockiae]MBF6176615.1 hypothetical protein [Nocardia blacklockiae]